MSTNPNPFDALGLPERPDLTDEQVRAAWRTIAAATHPDRPDGGDLARYTAASAAYAELRTPWGRSEAYADLADRARRAGHRADPGDARRRASRRPRRGSRCWPWCTSRRGSAAAARCGWLSARSSPRCCPWSCCRLIPGTPAAPADVLALVLWFVLTGRRDLAPRRNGEPRQTE